MSELTDDEIVAELARIAALSNNAHTRAYLLRNRGYWKRFPIRIWKFADGWRVVAASWPGASGSPDRCDRRNANRGGAGAVRPLFAGNMRWADYMATYSLTSPEALRVSGVITSDAATFVTGDGLVELAVPLDPMSFSPRDRPENLVGYLSPMHPAVKGWSQVEGAAEMPVALSRTGSNYSGRALRWGRAVLSVQSGAGRPGGTADCVWRATGCTSNGASAARPDDRPSIQYWR